MWQTRLRATWQQCKSQGKWFVGCGALSLFFYDNVGFVHTVRGKSMAPTINPGPTRAMLRERVWINKLPYYNPKVGDIICFKSPKHGTRLAMKRVAAVEGQTITPSKVVKNNLSPVKVKPGYVWVEADNCNQRGRDSNEYGQLHCKMIVGKVTWLLWPWSRVQDLRKTVTPFQEADQCWLDSSSVGPHSIDVVVDGTSNSGPHSRDNSSYNIGTAPQT